MSKGLREDEMDIVNLQAVIQQMSEELTQKNNKVYGLAQKIKLLNEQFDIQLQQLEQQEEYM